MISGIKLLIRSQVYGLGVVSGNRTLSHRRYEHVLPVAGLQEVKTKLPGSFAYDLVAYDSQKVTYTFCQCPDFGTVIEPTVGKVVQVSYRMTDKGKGVAV